MRSPRSNLTKILIFSLISLSFWSIYLGVSWGIADLLAQQARYNIQQWQKQGTINWPQTHTLLTWALYLNSNRPDFWELMGKAYYLLSTSTIDSQKQSMTLQRALACYLKVVQQRPVSAYAWANIALLKSLLKQYDTQFELALHQTAVFGPWESFTQQTVVELGLKTWYQLTKSTRLVVLTAIDRSLYLQNELTQSIIEQYQRQFVICSYRGQQHILLNQFCQQERQFFRRIK